MADRKADIIPGNPAALAAQAIGLEWFLAGMTGDIKSHSEAIAKSKADMATFKEPRSKRLAHASQHGRASDSPAI